MKNFLKAFCAVVTSFTAFAGEVSVTAVTAQQRYPWNGLVDIVVTMQGSADDVSLADCLFAVTNSATGTALPIEHVTQNGSDAHLGTTWTRKFVWDAKADIGAVKIADVALTVDVKVPGVQLWDGGPYWAECNVGATTPEEYGYYFCWSGTKGYKRVGSKWVSLDNSETDHSFYSSYCPTFYFYSTSEFEAAGYIDAAGNLPAAHDAATACLGPSWRMPTMAECSDLVKNCDVKVSARNGVPGWLVVGRSAYASRSIFIPGAGYGLNKGLNYADSVISTSCMSSTPMIAHATHGAYMLHFTSQGVTLNSYDRSYGNSVRPVRVFVK